MGSKAFLDLLLGISKSSSDLSLLVVEVDQNLSLTQALKNPKTLLYVYSHVGEAGL